MRENKKLREKKRVLNVMRKKNAHVKVSVSFLGGKCSIQLGFDTFHTISFCTNARKRDKESQSE